jgi:putative transposase
MTRPARLSREQYLAPQFCFVTVCTKDRRPTLVHPKVADFVVGEMSELLDAIEVDLTAYCVMPDHIHLLLEAETTSVDMRVVIERAKQRVGFRYAQLFGVPLWQRSYFDHTLRSDEAVESVIAYIVNNPIRAGFVTRPEDWPFWGAAHRSRSDLLETIATSGAGRRPGS